MAWFGKKEKKAGCCCGAECDAGTTAEAGEDKACGAAVKVLGSGCKKCNELERNAKAALAQLGMDTAVDHVTDFARIAAWGVMATPALVIDGKVVSSGKILKPEEIAEMLKK